MGRLQGKVALITGGGTGIGAATATRFAAEGANVTVCGRRLEPLQQVVKHIREVGGAGQARVLDVADDGAFTQTIDAVVEEHGRLDILVNNAYSMVGAPIEEMTTDDWYSCFRVTMDGTFFGTRAAFPVMRHQKSGAIVNLSSVCGLLGASHTAAYGAAKAGVINFSRAAAIEGAPFNIRVNVVIPGVVMSPGTEQALPTEDARLATAAGVPLQRIGEPEEVSNAILFLASDEASYVTGTQVVVDGGKTCELSSTAAMDGFDAT
jgi:NAD(P)-dependent dehydrogenase (short-subunit alcohol dehydrogenase family)